MTPTTSLCEFEFTQESSTRFLRTDITIQQALDAINTGLLDNKPIGKIKLFAISEDDDSISFIYDVAAAKSGNNPWSLHQLPSTQEN